MAPLPHFCKRELIETNLPMEKYNDSWVALTPFAARSWLCSIAVLMASTAFDSGMIELLLSMMGSVQNDEKFETAKVRKSGEIGKSATHYFCVENGNCFCDVAYEKRLRLFDEAFEIQYEFSFGLVETRRTTSCRAVVPRQPHKFKLHYPAALIGQPYKQITDSPSHSPRIRQCSR